MCTELALHTSVTKHLRHSKPVTPTVVIMETKFEWNGGYDYGTYHISAYHCNAAYRCFPQ